MAWVGGRTETPRISATRVTFLVVVVALVWMGNETPEAGAVSSWYGSTFFGIPANYLLFGICLLLALPFVAATPPFALVERLKQARLWFWVAVIWGVVCVSLAVALVRGVPELFADWRNLVVTAVVTVVAAKWLAAQSWRDRVIADLACVFGLLTVPILVGYFLGNGPNLFGVAITVFDGTTLYVASFAALAGTWHLLTARGQTLARSGPLALGTLSAVLVVSLSLRRSFWLVLGVGFAVVALKAMRARVGGEFRRFTISIGMGLVVVAAIFLMGTETVTARLESFSPTSSGLFASTNQDHVNDIRDAWQIIIREPILGLGIGRSYETDLISGWKAEAFDVHSAVLHAWLKFGILGAFAYVGFHIAWTRVSLRQFRTVPVGAFLVGSLVATLVGTWPYGRFQMAVFLGVLLALVLIEQDPRDARIEAPSVEDRLPAPA